jgi:hypothetical protein
MPNNSASIFDLMKEFRAHALFGSGRKVERLASLLESFRKPNVLLTRKHCETFVEVFTKTGQGCEYLELPAAKETCDEIISLCSKTEDAHLPKSSKIQSLFEELNKRIEVELKAHSYLCVPKDRSSLFKNPLKGWEATIAAFPSATYDIEEASKCLAFRRNTGSVFHLMRVMGAGLTALGKSLNEPTLDASHNLTWDNVLSRCVKELGEKFSGKSPAWRSDQEFYAKATATLLAIKDAWRNPNAHELGDKYTDDEAEDIYRTIRSFMRHLATKLKESP